MSAIATINPQNNEIVRQFEPHSPAQVAQGIERANEAWLAWKNLPLAQRVTYVHRLSDVLLERKHELAQLAALEMGKVLRESISEIEKCALTCRFYAEKAEQMLAPQPVGTEASRCYVAFEPLGVVSAIMPWNYPYWQVFRFAAPALAAGNVIVLKHAPNVPQCALAIASVFEQAGFPENVYTNFFLPNERVHELISHELVRAVTFTGSSYAGSVVASLAGKYLKKTLLELGGSDAFVVLADADVQAVAQKAVKARFTNGGQGCTSAKRFIVEKPIAAAFTAALREKIAALQAGDPTDPQTSFGPMAREDLAQILLEQVQKSVAAGAQVLVGGARPTKVGAWFEPTLLTNVKRGMPAYDEEMFGAVASVIVVENAQEAVAVANDTPYGLGASVWTANTEKGEKIAAQIQAGCTFVNEIVRTDPRVPFGGVKQSGYGRELSHWGMHEFVNIKTVWVA
ncbi:succinate-semialdehyde dehydrogenase / glutarate-semialdehyde dehydrogenase [Flexibacter flexilis DSM 6793]|uniref:Succinate-semialdehyde dehydrogenase / glutarate-semialdehyde dehydrogenase n=1 Tax=Flexibacter flexilis DSM 6793 TaxID=927664 RepID=A0A1I1EDN9_9BACT|nr:NAD-dependent succinate-semialdehyde dehydrogenase [Flexibacter flexilis]SFB83448.1 succinate-semialdehyde dehydrogenase / glutarate-semialdehyde dehydrogenase [Flexibacter flexilis DSM 6793]